MNKRFLILAISLLALPVTTSADVGTPLIWATMLHLVFGNALIGIGEGWLLSKYFDAPPRFSILIMIGANYFSAWIGRWLLGNQIVSHLDLNLYTAFPWICRLVAITYLLTLLLELPFVILCLPKETRWTRESLFANLIVQTASYGVLILWYAAASETSLVTKLKLFPPAAIDASDNAIVYFIAKEDGNIWSIRLNGSSRKKVYALGSHSEEDRLYVEKSSEDHWNLHARMEDGSDQGKRILIATNLASEAVTNINERDHSEEERTSRNYGRVPAIGPTNQWGFYVGSWAFEGIRGMNGSEGTRSHYAWETPFLEWRIRNATELPSSQLVFQLGRDQICVLDPNARRIVLLTRGQGPVVAVERETIVNKASGIK